MTCDELLQVLNSYVDDEAVAAIYQEFAEHLQGCQPCRVVVDNIRQTIQLFQNGEPYPMPPAFHERLTSLLRKKWLTKFPHAKV